MPAALRCIPSNTLFSGFDAERPQEYQEYPRFAPFRSLAYFVPVIDEVLEQPIPEGYTDYMRRKVEYLSSKTTKPPDRPMFRKIRFFVIANTKSLKALK